MSDQTSNQNSDDRKPQPAYVANPQAYLAKLPNTIEAVQAERATLLIQEASQTTKANSFLIAGLSSGVLAFVVPLGSCTSVLGSRLENLDDAFNTFVSSLIFFVVLGVIFGIVAASFRTKARALRKQIATLNAHEVWLHENGPLR
jgi:predicted cation transporter